MGTSLMPGAVSPVSAPVCGFRMRRSSRIRPRAQYTAYAIRFMTGRMRAIARQRGDQRAERCWSRRAATKCSRPDSTTRQDLLVDQFVDAGFEQARREEQQHDFGDAEKEPPRENLAAQLQQIKRQERERQADRDRRAYCIAVNVARLAEAEPVRKDHRLAAFTRNGERDQQGHAPPVRVLLCSFAATASMSRLSVRPWCFIHSTICTISTHATSTMPVWK